MDGILEEVGIDRRDLRLADVLLLRRVPAVVGVGVKGLKLPQGRARVARDEDVVLQAVEALVQVQACQVAGLVLVEVLDEGHGRAAHVGAVHLDRAAQGEQDRGAGAGFHARQGGFLQDFPIGISLGIVPLEQEAVGAQDHAVEVCVICHEDHAFLPFLRVCARCGRPARPGPRA